VVVKIPHVIGLTLLIGLMTMLISVFMYMAILPEEWDASFNKALPILDQGDYVPKAYLPAIRQILKACALTYVAAALADILRLWRWLVLLRYMR
ncbi:MAG: zinc metallopeptidase, partial [Gammaproteobacteria bacterium]|nr:zinc metallopeptidase [Gammaproteobacteria bacterium]